MGGFVIRRKYPKLVTFSIVVSISFLVYSFEANYQLSAVDCVTATWRDWGECSATCGKSHRTRTRKVFSNATYGGSCNSEQQEDCTKPECPPKPIECTITSWSLWGECSKSCGFGLQARKRELLTYEGKPPWYHSYNEWADESLGGARCPPLEEVRKCHGTHVHNAICGHGCKMGPWEQWSSCTKTCGERMDGVGALPRHL